MSRIDDMTAFERLIMRELRDHVESVADPRPIAEIAATAMRARRNPLAWLGWAGESPMSLPLPVRLALVAALAGAVLYLGVLVGGSRPTQPAPPLGQNGTIAFPAPDALTGRSAITLVGDRGAITTVTADRTGNASCPAWSAGGANLAWVQTSADGSEASIVVADPSGRHPRVIATHSAVQNSGEAPNIHGLSWSPDGSRISYVEGPALWVVPVGGGDSRVVVPVVFAASSAAWSPDGRRLAAKGPVDIGGRQQIGMQTVAADGTDPRVVALMGKPDPGEYAWSPDGSTIAYNYGGSVFTVGASGASERVQASLDTAISLTPSWSPDSRTLAFFNADSTDGDFPPTTSLVLHGRDVPLDAPRELFQPVDAGIGRGLRDVTWSPDGKWLLVVGHQDSTFRVVRVPLTGAQDEMVAAFEAGAPSARINDCPVAWQDNGIQPVP